MDYPLVSYKNAAPKYKVRDPEQRVSLDKEKIRLPLDSKLKGGRFVYPQASVLKTYQGIEACVTKEKNSIERMHTNIELQSK